LSDLLSTDGTTYLTSNLVSWLTGWLKFKLGTYIYIYRRVPRDVIKSGRACVVCNYAWFYFIDTMSVCLYALMRREATEGVGWRLGRKGYRVKKVS